MTLDVADDIAGFHAQQAVEKLYKALLSEHNEKFARTHQLELLQQHLARVGEQVPVLVFDVLKLTDYGVEFRYWPCPALTVADRELMAESVRVTRLFVESRVKELRRQAGIIP